MLVAGSATAVTKSLRNDVKTALVCMQPSAHPSAGHTMTQRRWCIPPGLIFGPGERLECEEVLFEVGGPVALLLWLSARDVRLWATCPDERRGGLFHPHAAKQRIALAAVLAGTAYPGPALHIIAALIATPEGARPGPIVNACSEWAQWCAERGWTRSSLAFWQAAAMAAPLDPELALRTGVEAVAAGQHARGESWLRRAIGLARRSAAWSTYARTHLELARLYRALGNRELARRYAIKTRRAGRRHGIREVRGDSFFLEFLLHRDAGQLREGLPYARAALRSYGKGHANSTGVLLELARAWADLDPARALGVLRRLPDACKGARDRIVASALRARAAAGAGLRAEFEEAWAATHALMRELGGDAVSRDVEDLLMTAAAEIRDWELMDKAAPRAPEVGERGKGREGKP
jgi:tetratricopeptide (TPR) repeat protein